MTEERWNPQICKETRGDVLKLRRAVLEGNGRKSLKDQVEDNHEALYGRPENPSDSGIVGSIEELKRKQIKHTVILGLLIFAPEAIETAKPLIMRIFAGI